MSERDRADLDAAIDHAEGLARECRGPCAAEHRQLVAWLRELRERRRVAPPVTDEGNALVDDLLASGRKHSAAAPGYKRREFR